MASWVHAVRRSRGPRLAAPVSLAVVVLLIALLLVRAGDHYQVTAVFEQAHGLVEGAEVHAGGLEVGSVEEIELGPDGFPHVTMKVSGDYRLRRGAGADLRAFSVAGEVNRYVMLRQGSGNDELEDGATLDLARTESPVEIDQVLATLDPATRADLRELFEGVDEATRGRGADIDRTLARSAAALSETADLLEQVNADGDALRTFVTSGRRVVSAVAREQASVGGTVDELSSLLQTTAARQRELAAALEGLPAGLRSPRLALERTRAAIPNLRALVRAARPAAGLLTPVSRDLRAVLADARPTLAEARLLIERGPADLERLDPLLDTVTPTLTRLDPVLREANPMLDQARARLPDVFAFFANWADFTSNYDANGHGARIGLVLAPAPPDSVGPSDSTRGHLVAPFQRTPGVLEGEPWKSFEESFIGGGGGR